MAIEYIMIGFREQLLRELNTYLPPDSVWVLEEPDLINRKVLDAARDLSSVAGINPAPLHGDERWKGALNDLPNTLSDSVAVLPMKEYTVVAAAAIADYLNRPGAGLDAALALRNKVRLRETLVGTDVAQPKWRRVASAAEVDNFRASSGGRCVLKPANRQSSLGVQIVSADDDIDAAWTMTTEADEPVMVHARDWQPHEFLVEEVLEGMEVSAEVLFLQGKPVFTNVTDKRVNPGRYPVELGHVVPSGLPLSVQKSIGERTVLIGKTLDFQSGLLHAEWMISPTGVPTLIECAGRLPGDDIVDLIDLAYGGSLVRDWMAVLRGDKPSVRPKRTRRGASVRFLQAPQGRVVRISGVEKANAMTDVDAVVIQTFVGAESRSVASSWDRPGRVRAVGIDGPSAERTAAAAAATVVIEIE